MKYCKTCGLPETYPQITFEEDGTCCYCKFYETHKEKIENKEEREQIFRKQIAVCKERAKDTGAPYDCIVGLSGGKDSTYIVWQMKHTYGMRVLAVTFQNGFHTEYGRNNIENALEKLDVDHITVRLNEQDLRKTYTKCVSVLKNFCSVCFHYMHYYCHEIAGRYGIPLIVNGRTKGQILQEKESYEPQKDTLSRFHFAREIPADGTLNLSWSAERISRFLRAMDYGVLSVMPKPKVYLGGKCYTFKTYKIIKSTAKEQSIIYKDNTLTIIKDGYEILLKKCVKI